MNDKDVLKELIKQQKELNIEIEKLKKKIKDSSVGNIRITKEVKGYDKTERTIYRLSVLGNNYGHGKSKFYTRWQSLYVSETKQGILNYLNDLEAFIKLQKAKLNMDIEKEAENSDTNEEHEDL